MCIMCVHSSVNEKCLEEDGGGRVVLSQGCVYILAAHQGAHVIFKHTLQNQVAYRPIRENKRKNTFLQNKVTEVSGAARLGLKTK